MPAQTLEDTITAQLLILLNDASRLLSVIGTKDFSAAQHQQLIHAAQVLALEWPTLAFSAQLERIGELILHITLSKDAIRITFSRAALRAAFVTGAETKPDRSIGDAYEAVVPARLKRCGIETRLVVANSKAAPAHSSSVDAIRTALAKALVNGTVATVRPSENIKNISLSITEWRAGKGPNLS